MAGTNFIGVNLCFATGYSQTYIVDPNVFTYNVGDYVPISGGSGYVSVKLTATTASSASYTGTSVPYGTFLEALQEANRLTTGFATDFCTAIVKSPANCNPLFSDEISWSYTAATTETGFKFYTSGGSEIFYPKDVDVTATDVAYKFAFSGTGYTIDCYTISDPNYTVSPTIIITGGSIGQTSFTNCNVCESTIFTAQSCCVLSEYSIIETSGFTLPAIEGQIVKTSDGCFTLLNKVTGVTAIYTAVTTNQETYGTCLSCIEDWNDLYGQSGTSYCYAQLRRSNVGCFGVTATYWKWNYSELGQQDFFPLGSSTSFKLFGGVSANTCYQQYGFLSPWSSFSSQTFSEFYGYSAFTNCGTCQSTSVGQFFKEKFCCSGYENTGTTWVWDPYSLYNVGDITLRYGAFGLSGDTNQVLSASTAVELISSSAFTTPVLYTFIYSSFTNCADAIYVSNDLKGDPGPWCQGKTGDSCGGFGSNFYYWDYTGITYVASGQSQNLFIPESNLSSSYYIELSGSSTPEDCISFSYTIDGRDQSIGMITGATLYSSDATYNTCSACTATTWVADACCTEGTKRIDVSNISVPFGEGFYVKTDAGCFQLLNPDPSGTPDFTANTATSALTYYVYSSCTECLEEYNRINFPGLPLDSCTESIYAVTCDTSTYGPYDIYWSYTTLGQFSGNTYTDIYPLPAVHDCWLKPNPSNVVTSPVEISYFTTYNNCATCTATSISYSAVSCCDPCEIVYIDTSSLGVVYVDDVVSDGSGCWKILGISNTSPTIVATTNYGPSCADCINVLNPDTGQCQVQLCPCDNNKCELTKYYFIYKPESNFCFTGSAFSILTDDGFRYEHYDLGDICFSSATVTWGTLPYPPLSNLNGIQNYPDCGKCTAGVWFSATSCCDSSKVEIINVTNYYNPQAGFVVTDYTSGDTYGAWTLIGSILYTEPQPSLFTAYWEVGFVDNDFTDCVSALSWYNDLLGNGANSWCVGYITDCDSSAYGGYYFDISNPSVSGLSVNPSTSAFTINGGALCYNDIVTDFSTYSPSVQITSYIAYVDCTTCGTDNTPTPTPSLTVTPTITLSPSATPILTQSVTPSITPTTSFGYNCFCTQLNVSNVDINNSDTASIYVSYFNCHNGLIESSAITTSGTYYICNNTGSTEGLYGISLLLEYTNEGIPYNNKENPEFFYSTYSVSNVNCILDEDCGPCQGQSISFEYVCDNLTPTPTPSFTPTPFLTPSITPTNTTPPNLNFTSYFYCDLISPTPTQTLTNTPFLTPTPSSTSGLTPTVTPSVTVTPFFTPTVSQTPDCLTIEFEYVCDNLTPTPTPSVTLTPFLTPSVTPTNTTPAFLNVSVYFYCDLISPTPTQTVTNTPFLTQTPSSTSGLTPTVTPSVSVTPFFTPTVTQTPNCITIEFEYVCENLTPTPTPSVTLTPFLTPSVTPTNTLLPDLNVSVYFYCDLITPTPTQTVTNTPFLTQTPSSTSGLTPTVTPSFSVTPFFTPTVSQTPDCITIEFEYVCENLTPTPTPTNTVTPFLTPSVTPTNTLPPNLGVSVYFYCELVTPTPTSIVASPTPSITPSLTPNACFCYDVIITQHDIDSASGNTNPVANGRVTVIYYDCDEIPQPFSVTSAGTYTICNKPSETIDNLGIEVFITYTQDDEGYNNLDDSQLFTSQYITEYSSCSQDGDCIPITQTPTPTATPTPGLSLTPTVTPTLTPFFTPSPSPDCSGVAISFEYICENLTPTPTPTVTLTPGLTPSVTPTNTLLPNLGVSVYFYCDINTPTPTLTPFLTPTPSLTPYITPTQTPNCITIEFEYICENLTPTPTPTVTITPFLTPSVTPTNTLLPNLGVSVYMYCDLVTPTSTPTVTPTLSITPTISITPSITPTITVTSSITPSVTKTPSQTPACIVIDFQYICENLTPTPTPTQTLTPFLTPSVTPTNTLPPNLNVSVYFYCELTSPTPTQTPFLTPTPTNTPFLSPSITPTPTQTPNCITIEFEYVCDNLTPTPTATVTVTPFLTPSPTPTVTVAPFLDVSAYFYCLDVTPTPTQTSFLTPTPTLTPFVTPTQTSNCIVISFEYVCENLTPTPTPTQTLTPFLTPSVTPTNTLPPNLGVSSYFYCLNVTPTPTVSSNISPTPTLTPFLTPTVTPTISQTPNCIIIEFEYVCDNLTPTPTPTNTLTPFLTPTPTPTTTMAPNLGANIYFYCELVTPTVTPTPTQTLPNIYWFSGCCEINDITFGLYNLPVSVIVGEVYYVEIEGIFSGCSTVITTATGGIYGNSTLVNYTDCVECITNNPCIPIPSVTPTPTVTQTPNCITIEFEYVCENLTPTPTPTQTLTPFLTQTPTPTTTLAPNLGASSYFYCDLVTPTPTLTPFFTPTPTQTPTVTLTSFLTPTPTLTPFFTPTPSSDCGGVSISFEYVCENLTPTPTPTVTVTPFLTPTITPTETLPPYLNASVYLYCELVTPTPTPNIMTPTPTQTATVTPTLTPGLTGCGVYQYCVHLGNPDYDGTYVNSGYYNGHSYYLNSGTNSVIYYNNTTWCVSDTLGGTCILYGSVPPTSPCPSFSNTVFSVGECPTPTPTPTPSVTPTLTPTVSPTATLTPTPAVTTSPTVTPTVTPTGTNACIGVQAYSIIEEVPNPSPTPSVTPTSTVGKVSFNGEGVFVVLNDTFVCN